MTFKVDTIYNGNCIEIMMEFPENSIDMIFADPPYNLQLQKDLFRPNMTKVLGVTDEWDKFASFTEYDEFTKNWLIACRRVLKSTGTIWVIGSYHNIFRVGSILQDLGYWILNDIIWVKTNPMPNFRGVRFANAHETLIWAQKEKGRGYSFNYRTLKSGNDDIQLRSDWYYPICSGRERLKINGDKAHSTQKPEALLHRVINSCTKPGDIILDPFFGSGTTGAVARKLKRHWIGIEQIRKYAAVAKRRINHITITSNPDSDFMPIEPKKQLRIPFSQLIDLGFMSIGDHVVIPNTKVEATVVANGLVKYKDITGSIHVVASKLIGRKVNGWAHWYAKRPNNNLISINELRDKARIIMVSRDSKSKKGK